MRTRRVEVRVSRDWRQCLWHFFVLWLPLLAFEGMLAYFVYWVIWLAGTR